MNWLKAKQELLKLEKSKLVALIGELYHKNNSVRTYLDLLGNPDFNLLHLKHKRIVKRAFDAMKHTRPDLKAAKKSIADYKKLGAPSEYLADLMLYYVECGVEFTVNFGDIDEPFYSSIEKIFDKFLAYAYKEEILDSYKARSRKVVQDTEDIGWGFHDQLAGSYYDYYSD